MKPVVPALALAAVLALAGCAGASQPAPAPVVDTSAPPVASVASYNRTACQAFHQATTRGVPASAAGMDTLTWLNLQITGASRQIQDQVFYFIQGWHAKPVNLKEIRRATKAVRGLCGPYGGA
jgi:ABC-type glycerol-3-phosphate transport system substrate-binding protein